MKEDLYIFLYGSSTERMQIVAHTLLQEKKDALITLLTEESVQEIEQASARSQAWQYAPRQELNTLAARHCALSPAALLLLFHAGFQPCAGFLTALIKALTTAAHPCCAAPLQLRPDRCIPQKLRVLSQGFAVSSQGTLISLSEGHLADDKKVQKQRLVQLAATQVLLVRLKDFCAAGGLNLNLDPDLQGFDLQCRLRAVTAGLICVEPSARVVLDDPLATWALMGLFNSHMERGRIDPHLLQTDAHVFAALDNQPYRADDWLNEGPFEAAPKDRTNNVEEAWLTFREHPCPQHLLAYLALAPHEEKSRVRRLCQLFPCNLPHAFAWYEVKAKTMLSYAKKAQLYELEADLIRWQNSRERFHHDLLLGLEALRDASFYRGALDLLPSAYEAWMELVEPKLPCCSELSSAVSHPTIALLMPVYNPDLDYLSQAIDSVLAQSYPNFQLCLADDASTQEGVQDFLQSMARKDKRLSLVLRPQNGNISLASNSALDLSDAPFAAYMDQDDLLTENALEETARHLLTHPHHRYVYSDEDHIDEKNIRRTPTFKADYDCCLQGSVHLSTYASSLLRELNGLRTGYEGAQDYDLGLRAFDHLPFSAIGHIPRILYHWRIHPSSTAGSIQAKPYVLEAQKKALADHAKRLGVSGMILPSYKNRFFRLLITSKPHLSVSLIVLGDTKKLAPGFLQSMSTLSQLCEVLWQPLGQELHMPRLLSAFLKSHYPEVSCRSLPAETLWQEACTKAARTAQGELLLFLSASLLPREGCRPEQLTALAAQRSIALSTGHLFYHDTAFDVGLYPDPDTDGVFPLGQGFSENTLNDLFLHQTLMTRRTLGSKGKTLALSCRRELLLAAGGLNTAMGPFAIADYVLRQEKEDMIALTSPWAAWKIQPRSETEETQKAERAEEAKARKTFLKIWKERLAEHPLRSPHFRRSDDNAWELKL